MENSNEYQIWLVRCLKAMQLDEGAIMFIMLALEEEEQQREMLSFIADNYQTTNQQEIMMLAAEIAGAEIEL